MFRGNVKGGTGAASRMRAAKDIAKCECGSFIAKLRADAGATLCVRCETEADRKGKP